MTWSFWQLSVDLSFIVQFLKNVIGITTGEVIACFLSLRDKIVISIRVSRGDHRADPHGLRGLTRVEVAPVLQKVGLICVVFRKKFIGEKFLVVFFGTVQNLILELDVWFCG